MALLLLLLFAPSRQSTFGRMAAPVVHSLPCASSQETKKYPIPPLQWLLGTFALGSQALPANKSHGELRCAPSTLAKVGNDVVRAIGESDNRAGPFLCLVPAPSRNSPPPCPRALLSSTSTLPPGKNMPYAQHCRSSSQPPPSPLLAVHNPSFRDTPLRTSTLDPKLYFYFPDLRARRARKWRQKTRRRRPRADTAGGRRSGWGWPRGWLRWLLPPSTEPEVKKRRIFLFPRRINSSADISHDLILVDRCYLFHFMLRGKSLHGV